MNVPNFKELRFPLIILLISFLIRLIFLNQFSSNILFENHIVDMAYHDSWAKAIASGQQFIDGSFFRAPLYPYFLGSIYYLLGESLWLPRLIQIFIGSLSCVLVYFIALKIFCRKTAMIAGLIMSCYGPLIFYDAQLLSETLTIFLFLAFIFSLGKTIEKPSLLNFILSGFIAGLAAISRPTILIFAVIILIYFIVQFIRGRFKFKINHLAMGLLFSFIPILPVTIYNYSQANELIMISSYGGINFYIGNYDGADGVSPVIPGVRPDWQGGKEDTRRLAQNETGRQMTEAEISDFYYKKGVRDIFEDPVRFFKLIVKKSVLLIEGNELSNNFDFYYFAYQSGLMKILIGNKFVFYPWGLLFPLAVLGMIFAAADRKHKRLLLIYFFSYLPALLLFLVTARYRLFLVPVMIIFSAAFLIYLKDKFSQTTQKNQFIMVSLFLIMLFAGNSDLYGYTGKSPAKAYHSIASIHSNRGDMVQSEKYLRMALKEDPNLVESINDLALLNASRGNYEYGIKLLEHGLTLPNSNYMQQYNLGVLYLQNNQLLKARPLFDEVVKFAPDFSYAYNNLGLTYLWLENYDSALIVYKQLSQEDPAFALTDYQLGMCHLGLSNTDSAKFYFEIYVNHPLADSGLLPTARYLLDSLREM